MAQSDQVDVVVAGGGIAGLAAAAYLGRGGLSVALFEKARDCGGRAATHDESGFKFNLGPHALYRGCDGMSVLSELGVSFTGKTPGASGGYALFGGRKHALPGGFVSLLTTSLLGLSGKIEVARLLASLQKFDPEAAMHTDVASWLRSNVRDQTARALLQALFRLTTYANAPTIQAAGPALRQLQVALSKNVFYLDGGWQTLVDGLRRVAQDAGTRLTTGCRVAEIVYDGDAVAAVRLSDASQLACNAVVIAGSPRDAAALAPASKTPLQQWAQESIPVRAACLNLGLKRLPNPRANFALGVDQPLYLSVHSASAQLAPAGSALVQLAKYLPADSDTDPRQDQRELEQTMDLVHPGWRSEVVTQQFLPNMTVAHAIVTVPMGGYRGRPPVVVPGVSGLYLAGDWVGPNGWLADASLASARQAAQRVIAQPRLRVLSAA